MEYRVLARKYRPATFDDLIGQEALVRTLSNAIKTGRIAHAFLLTGIRGVGKTTTARIIARALDCEKGPTINPCGVCTHCKMIAEDRHVDVLEMDAASHTGVDDMRDLIDAAHYLPGSARYKVYIIDEVHMLSTNAFNALLKTLEEPPPHVKFVFATTEARKIPVTILSRCQRFDLKRVSQETLAAHLEKIAAKENIAIENPAAALIAANAEGSVRDGLSLLDQAIAKADGQGITETLVRQMIGASDKAATFRLLEILLGGDISGALAALAAQYQEGADPLLIVQDALEVTHLITRAKVVPAALSDVSLSERDRAGAKKMADTLPMAQIARLWQMLLKGIDEVRAAPQPPAALEMLLVRIAYAAQLPTPAEVIRTFPSPVSGGGSGREQVNATVAQVTPPPHPSPLQGEGVNSFSDVVALFEQKREAWLYAHLKQDARLVSFAPGKIEIRLTSPQPRDFTTRVANCLTEWTGEKWAVILSEAEGAPSLHEQEQARKEKRLVDASAHPLVAGVLEQFPGARVVGVKEAV
ncbi:MAG: DNA polymerase III subunit gamma/tau [Pseudomonadota bacterium]|nr:DNA polymerase III subunit gamma/tau [Pseudomonadota bacterium]MDE3037608.1 DNA polymerase III subunit gamma/tau [Pseudomonadota bacterium]